MLAVSFIPLATGLEILANVGRIWNWRIIIIEQVLVGLVDFWLSQLRLYQAWLQTFIKSCSPVSELNTL